MGVKISCDLCGTDIKTNRFSFEVYNMESEEAIKEGDCCEDCSGQIKDYIETHDFKGEKNGKERKS